MSAREIIQSLISTRLRAAFCVPNFTPANWWECDVFEITKAGYFREYEVKLSRADFFADAKKEQRKPGAGRWVEGGDGQRARYVTEMENKHALLGAADPRGPVQFWFVTPPGLLTLADLPAWAGLIEVTDRGAGFTFGRFAEHEVKAAPRLHRTKIDDAIRRHALTACYYRMHDLLTRRAA